MDSTAPPATTPAAGGTTTAFPFYSYSQTTTTHSDSSTAAPICSFRVKGDKKSFGGMGSATALRSANTTLDSTHREFVQTFSDNDKLIESYRTRMQALRRSLHRRQSAFTPGQIKARRDREHELHQLREKVRQLVQKKKSYYLDNTPLIFDYFETRKHMSEGTVPTLTRPAIESACTHVPSKKNKIIQTFFQPRAQAAAQLATADVPGAPNRPFLPMPSTRQSAPLEADIAAAAAADRASTVILSGGIELAENGVVRNQFLQPMAYYQPPTLVRGMDSTNSVLKYLSNVRDEFLDIDNFTVPKNLCHQCRESEMLPVEEDGMLVCDNCGFCLTGFIETTEKCNFQDLTSDVPVTNITKRLARFKEILNQLQGKETTPAIPAAVMERIRIQVRKEHIAPAALSNKKVKEILKMMKLSKYYDRAPYIRSVFGLPPPRLSDAVFEDLCQMFLELQEPYAQVCMPQRIKFFNYHYTVYKLLELKEEHELKMQCPMIKDPKKIIEHDNIWKKICAITGRPFIPTT